MVFIFTGNKYTLKKILKIKKNMMDGQYIIAQSEYIRKTLSKGRIEEALVSLDKFIQEIGDRDLDNRIVNMAARYHSDVKDKLNGLRDTNKEQNQIINALIGLLADSKEVAKDKLELYRNSEIEKLGIQGRKTFDYLDDVIILLAESRLFELDIMQPNFDRILSEKQNRIFREHRQRFKDLLTEIKNKP